MAHQRAADRLAVGFYAVDLGTIARRVGQPHDQDAWQWLCGFYPGSNPGDQTVGTAPTIDQARADFEVAWRTFSARRTPADYQAWRNQREWMARKYDRWERGERLPPRQMIR